MRGLILLFALWTGGCAASHPTRIRCDRHLTPINAGSAQPARRLSAPLARAAGAAP